MVQVISILALIFFLLLFPLSVGIYGYYSDEFDRGEAYFSVALFGVIELFGGFIRPCEKGIIVHYSQKNALIMYYKDILGIGKQLEVTKGFKLSSLSLLFEVGGDNINLPYMFSMGEYLIASIVFSIIKTKYRHINFTNNNVILEGVNRFSAAIRLSYSFNLLLVIIAVVKIILEKILEKT